MAGERKEIHHIPLPQTRHQLLLAEFASVAIGDAVASQHKMP
jgi:hypothetical protein